MITNNYNHFKVKSSKLLSHKSVWIFFLSLFFIIMVIPSIIVYWTGHVAHYHDLFNQSNQKQNSTTFQNGLESVLKQSVTIGWVSANNQSLPELTGYKNLKVVSPALATIDNQYNLQVISNSTVTNSIQAQGKMVWARIIMNTDTKTKVHAFLINQKKVLDLIKKIHQVALIHNWYGVNIDIENVSKEDREAFSQFIKNLSAELNKTSIILSIDLPPDPNGKNNNQSPFDHTVIGKYCNYIIFMGYDQHWSSDPVPGPVTSLPWLNQNLQEFIQTGIPSEKLILGLPTYTRIWEQNQQGSIVKDPAEPIQYVESLAEQNHRNLTWDSTLGEYYISYFANNLHYKIWLPTVKSFNIYLNLISQYHLGGSAVWNLNFINTDYWNRIYNK